MKWLVHVVCEKAVAAHDDAAQAVIAPKTWHGRSSRGANRALGSRVSARPLEAKKLVHKNLRLLGPFSEDAIVLLGNSDK